MNGQTPVAPARDGGPATGMAVRHRLTAGRSTRGVTFASSPRGAYAGREKRGKGRPVPPELARTSRPSSSISRSQVGASTGGMRSFAIR